jgi:mannose-6-phosphate isomerase
MRNGVASGCRYSCSNRIMSKINLTSPLTFDPIFMERIWGGRRLESEYGKKLPAEQQIGESWEIVDRPEAQSVVANGPLKGKTLHEIWATQRKEIFGEPPESQRFPLLVKLLDAKERLSLQVHPPEKVAAKLGGEPKTEFWYVASTQPDAKLFVGLREAMTRAQFEEALRSATVAEHVHEISVKPDDAMFLPAGRLHAVGAGNILVEIQQNSDTTYRVFDWNRAGKDDKGRQLHIEQALQCIDFNDVAPGLIEPRGEVLVNHKLFEVQKWILNRPRQIVPRGQFAIICCLTGSLQCANVDLASGEFFLVPAELRDGELRPLRSETSLLCVTIPEL